MTCTPLSNPKLPRDILHEGQCRGHVVHAQSDTVLEPAFPDGVAALFVSSEMFSDFLGVLIHSILLNTSLKRHYDLIILTSDMTVESINRISDPADTYTNVSIRFVDVTSLLESYTFPVTGKNYNQLTYYRLLLPDLMRRFNKVLYLDADVLVDADIADIYDTDINEFDFAAAYDVLIACWQRSSDNWRTYYDSIGLGETGDVIQAGVILFNIKALSDHFPDGKLLQLAMERSYRLNDQDLLSVCCKGRIKPLAIEWNMQCLYKGTAEMLDAWLPQNLYDEYVEARTHPKIHHFSEKQFPCWKPDADFAEKYWAYARNTPFYERLLQKAIECSIGKALGCHDKTYYATAANGQKPLETEVNVVSIMENIRAGISIPGLQPGMDELDGQINAFVPGYRALSGGNLKRFLKRLIRKATKFYVEPILADQNAYNTHLLNMVRSLEHQVRTQQKQLNRLASQAERHIECSIGKALGCHDKTYYATAANGQKPLETEVNVVSIMENIRAGISIPELQPGMDELDGQLNAFVPGYRALSGGNLKRFLKRLIRKATKFYVEPILADQNAYNAHLLNMVRSLVQQVRTQQKQLNRLASQAERHQD